MKRFPKETCQRKGGKKPHMVTPCEFGNATMIGGTSLFLLVAYVVTLNSFALLSRLDWERLPPEDKKTFLDKVEFPTEAEKYTQHLIKKYPDNTGLWYMVSCGLGEWAGTGLSGLFSPKSLEEQLMGMGPKEKEHIENSFLMKARENLLRKDSRYKFGALQR
jgi:hypothetical protein